MAHHQRKHHHKHRRLRFTRLYGALCVLLILAAVVAGCIIFFKVDTIEVEGNDRYTQQEIVDVSGIQSGDNMFLFNKFDSINSILTKLSYVESVSIRRSLPSTVHITVTECTATAAVKDEERDCWWLVNSSGKIVERTEDTPSIPEVTGLAPVDPTVGQAMNVSDDQRLQLEAMTGLLSSLENRELLSNVNSFDLSSTSVALMQYDGRIEVRFKLSSDYDYEVRILGEVMTDYVEAKWKDTDTGTLDFTLDDGQPHLIKNAT